MGKLSGKKIAFVATDGVEQVELTEPWNAVKGEGAAVELLSLEDGQIQGFNHLDHGDKFDVDKTVASADSSDYDALVLPGGVANPEFLSGDRDVQRFVRSRRSVMGRGR
jgi:protease I